MFTKGLGQHFESPRRPRNKSKTQVFVPVSLLDIKRRRLLARLRELESKPSEMLQDQAYPSHDEIMDDEIEIDDDGAYYDPMDPDYIPSDKEDSRSSHHTPMEEDLSIVLDSEAPDEKRSNPGNRRILPDPPAKRLYTSWKTLISSLVLPYQHYTSRTSAKPLSKPPASISLCEQAACVRKFSKLLCLFFDRKLLSRSFLR